MEKLEHIEDEMIESVELMQEAYELFNQVLKKNNAVDKSMACCLMDALSKKFKMDVRNKEEEIASIKEKLGENVKVSIDEKAVKDRKMEKFLRETEKLQTIMLMTEVALQKYFPLNNRGQAFKKKRNRLRKMRSKTIGK